MIAHHRWPVSRFTIVVLFLAACGDSDVAELAPDAGPRTPDAGDRTDAAAPHPCANLALPAPHTIADMLARVDALPEPTIDCLVRSLPRPLSLVASLSSASLQPAVDSNTPRIFVMLDGLSISVVGAGEGANAVELGQWITPTRTLKGEIRFPVTRPIAADEPYRSVTDPSFSVTSCGFCHSTEEPYGNVPGAFVSDALAPLRWAELAIEDVRALRASCSDEPYCAILRALFDHGEVRQGAFADEVKEGF